MTTLIRTLAAIAILAIPVSGGFAQSPSPIQSPFVAIPNESPPRLFVDAPLPGPLARGAVLIPYRVENFRILPVLGPGAATVSPRVGHLHVTVDDLPWHWGDFGDNQTIVLVGLPPGPHKVLLELADPEHRIHTGQAVTFTVPGPTK